MSSRSEVALQCGANVFEKVRPIYERYECPPDELFDSGDGSRIIHWRGIEWVETDEFVAEITAALESFDDADEMDNGYKLVEIGENNYCDEKCNDAGLEWFTDFYPTMIIEMPEGITEIKN